MMPAGRFVLDLMALTAAVEADVRIGDFFGEVIRRTARMGEPSYREPSGLRRDRRAEVFEVNASVRGGGTGVVPLGGDGGRKKVSGEKPRELREGVFVNSGALPSNPGVPPGVGVSRGGTGKAHGRAASVGENCILVFGSNIYHDGGGEP